MRDSRERFDREMRHQSVRLLVPYVIPVCADSVRSARLRQ